MAEDELARCVGKNKNCRVERLRQLAGLGLEERTFYFSGFAQAVLYCVFALLCLAVAVATGIVVFTLVMANDADIHMATLPLLACGALLLSGLAPIFFRQSARFRRLHKQPFLTLTAQGIVFADLSEPLPWTSIIRYTARPALLGYLGQLALTLNLAEGYTPVFTSNVCIRHKTEKHQLLLKIFRLRPRMNPYAFIRIFHDYMLGANARANLENMKNLAAHPL